MRMQLTKVIDYLRSELEDIRFSNVSLEITMAALERIQARHTGPAAREGERTGPLTRTEIKEYFRMKREMVSPRSSIFADSRAASEQSDSDIEMESNEVTTDADGAVTEMRSHDHTLGSGTNISIAHSQPTHPEPQDTDDDSDADTDISSEGLTNVLPSEHNVEDSSVELGSSDSDTEGTAISSAGFSMESDTQTPTATPAKVVAAAPVPRLRGLVKFPSRENPMPYLVGLPSSLPSRSPLIVASDPYPRVPGTDLKRRKSDSPIVTAGPIPMPTRGYAGSVPRPSGPTEQKGKQPTRSQGLEADVIDLTTTHAPTLQQPVLDLDSSPLTSIPSSLPT